MSDLQNQIFYPMFALILWTAIVLVIMFKRRVSAIKSKQVSFDYFKTYQLDESKLPQLMLQASRNFTNLFEVPTLYYAIILFGRSAFVVDRVFIIMAWSFVLLRILHSYIHLTSNKVILRMRVVS